MARRLMNRMLVFGCATALALPSLTHATNGYFLIGYGAKSRAMGGTGVANGTDALAAAANPAAMTDVDIDTMRIDVGAELFVPRRAAYHDSDDLPANHVSGSNQFLIPNMGGIYKFNRKMTMGMAVIGNGANTRYDQSYLNGHGDFFNYNQTALVEGGQEPLAGQTLGVNLLQMQMLPSIAYKVNKNHSIGASLAIGVQSFRAYGLGAFGELGFSEELDKLTNNGNDWSYGAGVRLGWLGKFFGQRLKLGANYASRVYMTEFDKYTGLFAEQGDFDIPEHYSLGLAFKASEKLTLAFDYQRINYSDIASVGNPGPLAVDPPDNIGQLFPTPATDPDGSSVHLTGKDDGLGFGWNDLNIYKIGVSYDYSDRWTFMAGYDYNDGQIDEDQILFNLLAPAVIKHHATLGLSYRPDKSNEFTVNWLHGFKETLNGPTRFSGSTLPGNDNASGEMYIWSLGVSYSYKM